MKKSIRFFFILRQRIERKIFHYLFKKNNLSLLPVDNNSIVLLGDSQTQFFEVPRYYKNKNIRNRGVSGDRTDQVLDRLGEITFGKPKKIFIEIGVNDLLQGISVEITFKNINLIISGIEKDSPETKIYVQNILPTEEHLQFFSQNGVLVLPLIKILNEQILALCIMKNITHINLFDGFYLNNGLNPRYDCGDGLHLNHK